MREEVLLLVSCGFILAQGSPRISFSSTESQRDIDERMWMRNKQSWYHQVEQQEDSSSSWNSNASKHMIVILTIGVLIPLMPLGCCVLSHLTSVCKKSLGVQRQQQPPVLTVNDRCYLGSDLRIGVPRIVEDQPPPTYEEAIGPPLYDQVQCVKSPRIDQFWGETV